MAEYIEKNYAVQCAADVAQDMRNDGLIAEASGADAVCDWLKDIPAADVRPVVTCGKCKYGKYTGTEWFCDKHSGHADKLGEDASYHEYHGKHWFCADGEART